MEPPAKKTKVSTKDNPPGIFDHNSGKKQARLLGFKVDGKACQKPIPGLYTDVPAALAAQADAQQKLADGGPQAVWPNWDAPPSGRSQRGSVRAPSSLIGIAIACALTVMRLLCAQGSKRALEAAEKRAEKPPSKGNLHKSKGVGRGAGTQRGEKGRFESAPDANKPRDPQLPTSVPMPSAVEDITDAGMRAMWEQEAASGADATGPEPLD